MNHHLLTIYELGFHFFGGLRQMYKILGRAAELLSCEASYLHRRLRHELRLPLDDMTYFQLAGAHLGRRNQCHPIAK